MNAEARYYVLLEQLIQAMTTLDQFDLRKIYSTLAELCQIMGISRGVTTFYENLADEARGMGEEFVCYDSGEKSVLVSRKRTVNPTQMVVTCSVYQPEGAEPLSPETMERVDLIQRMMLSYINRTRLERTIERLSFMDNDGYYNMRYFLAQLTREGMAGKLSGKTAMRFNLKHFSLINQRFGRNAGNAAMMAYYRQLTEAAGPGGFVARMGGDNFIGICDAGREEAVIQLLKGQAVECGVRTGADGVSEKAQVTVNAIAGLYAIPKDYEFHDPGEIIDKINSTYQSAKESGVGDVVYYSDDILLEKEKIMRVQQRFVRALKQEEFLVYYQPKVDIKNKELIGAEALCRWMHHGELIPPMDFIPVLERGADICKLDFYMLDHVCRDIRRWLDAGMQVVRVSVNLSRRHMTDPDLFDHIVEIIDRHNVPHEYIEIELTETTTDVEFKDLKRVVSGLQKAGISTSVDDFGVGYSSLNLIKEIPWDVLKLDKSMLPANEKTRRGSLMFKHIIAMAHEIGTMCVAEGVETSEQMKVLSDNGCSIAQGFFFDRPLPCADFEERLKIHHY